MSLPLRACQSSHIVPVMKSGPRRCVNIVHGPDLTNLSKRP